MNSRQAIISRALALSLFLTLVERAEVVRLAFGPLFDIQSTPTALLVIWTWLLLMAGTLAGLTSARRWGAYVLAALVPLSTFLMSIPLIPGLTALMPASFQFPVLVTLNLIVLAAVPILVREPASVNVNSANANV